MFSVIQQLYSASPYLAFMLVSVLVLVVLSSLKPVLWVLSLFLVPLKKPLKAVRTMLTVLQVICVVVCAFSVYKVIADFESIKQAVLGLLA